MHKPARRNQPLFPRVAKQPHPPLVQSPLTIVHCLCHTAPMQVRLVTWNLHGPPLARRQTQRFQAAAQRLLQTPQPLPDFVLLQEVWFPSKAELLTDQFKLAYDAVDVPHNSFPGRAGGLLTLVRRDAGWKIRSHGFEEFTTTAPAWRFWEGDGVSGKGVQCIDLECNGTRVVLCNTHLQAQYGDRAYADVRADQIRQLNQLAQRLPASLPVIAAGDFNTRPAEPLFDQLTSQWLELTRTLRERCDCGTTVPTGEPAEWIDYVFARAQPNWRVRCDRAERIENTTTDVPYSDHHGLDVTLNIEPGLSTSTVTAAAAISVLHGPSTRRDWLLGWLALGLQRLLDRVSS